MELLTNNYDLIFLGIIIVSAIFALIRGGVNEILSISSWFIALWTMHKYGNIVNEFIPHKIDNPLLRSVIIYLSIFIIIALLIAIIKKLLAGLINKLGLGGLNYLIGFGFGIIRGIFICAILSIILEILNLDSTHNWNKAKTYIFIKPVVTLIMNTIPDNLKSKKSDIIKNGSSYDKILKL